MLKLPSITKGEAGGYMPRALDGSLAEVVSLRSRLLLEALKSYRPDLLVVDHKPVGLCGELLDVLQAARRLGVRTLLGLRDILDSPSVVAEEWGAPTVRVALRESYDRVCVYGDPSVFDARTEYTVPPELGARMEFTGYVARPTDGVSFRPFPLLRPRVLVTVGGGEDGLERLELYLDALALAPAGWSSTLVLGPLLPADAVRSILRRAEGLEDVEVHRFHEDLPGLLEESSAVVAMCGYNTAVEVLRSRTPAVFLPRTAPRREQALRASRLAELGLATCLERPGPSDLRAALERAVDQGRMTAPLPDLDGRAGLVAVALELIGEPSVAQAKKETAPR